MDSVPQSVRQWQGVKSGMQEFMDADVLGFVVGSLFEVTGRVRAHARGEPSLDVVPAKGYSLGQLLARFRDQVVTIGIYSAELTRCSYCATELPLLGGRGHARGRRAVCGQPDCIRAAERDRKRDWRARGRTA
jgi:hypothetical protein